MKKFNKVFLCILLCAIFLTFTFSSVSAMKKRTESVFHMDEELETSQPTEVMEAASGDATMAPVHMSLQTPDMMKIKQDDFLFKYWEILGISAYQVDHFLNWKKEIFLYLKTLYKQLHEHPTSINDQQILDFFINIIKSIRPNEILPSFENGDYRIKFNPMHGISGAIICTSVTNPHHILAQL